LNLRVAVILMFACLMALIPLRLNAAAADDETARLLAPLRDAGSELAGWTLAAVESDAGSMRTRWKNRNSGEELSVLLHARNDANPAFSVTRLYNIFAETSDGAPGLSDSGRRLLEAFSEYVRTNEASASKLLPYEDYRRNLELQRAAGVQKKKDSDLRRAELERKNLKRMLPAGITMRNIGENAAPWLALLPVLMIFASLYVSRIMQPELEESGREYMRDFLNRAFKLVTVLQAALAARGFENGAPMNPADSPLLSDNRPFDFISNVFTFFVLGGEEARYIGALLVFGVLFFFFIHATTLLSFLVLKDRTQALMAAVFTCSFPWFLLPAHMLPTLLLFGWFFMLALICAVLLTRFSHHEWRLSGVMALAVAAACLIHPLGLLAAVSVPLAAVLNINEARAAAGRFSFWAVWFAGVLSSALLLLKIQAVNPDMPYGGVFADSPAQFMKNLSHLCWFNLSMNSLPHMIFAAGGFIMLLRRRSAAPELPLLALMLPVAALMCAAFPLSPGHPLLYGGLPALAGLAAAPTLKDLWTHLEGRRFALRLLALSVAALLCAASPLLSDALC